MEIIYAYFSLIFFHQQNLLLLNDTKYFILLKFFYLPFSVYFKTNSKNVSEMDILSRKATQSNLVRHFSQ